MISTDMIMFGLILVLACASTVRLHPTSCAEDSQCPSEFYCQEESHLCVECLRCEELKREARLPRDVCAKSLTECGDCLKGLVQVYDVALKAQCKSGVENTTGGILPPYGWVAIAFSLVLMVVILCLFARVKSFKVAYAARTSVQSLQPVPLLEGACAPPPPYHDLDNASPALQPEAIEMQKLSEHPHCRGSSSPEMRPRENSSNQSARVCNNPIYARTPENGNGHSPGSEVSGIGGFRSDNIATATSGGRDDATATTEQAWTVSTIADNTVNKTKNFDCGKGGGNISATTRKSTPDQEDSNNNFPEGQESTANRRATSYCNGIVAGPSFIINVVENINNATMTHAEYNT